MFSSFKSQILLIVAGIAVLAGAFFMYQTTKKTLDPVAEAQKRLDDILPIIPKQLQYDTTTNGTTMVIDSHYKIVKPFSFINQDSQAINQDFTKGKIYCANFFFTTCEEACPRMQNAFKEAIYDKLKGNPNIVFLSHSVDPDFDQPEMLKDYADSLKVSGKQWQFLTGSKKELYSMARYDYYLAVQEQDKSIEGTKSDFLHSQNIALVDQQGRMRGQYDSFNPKELIQLYKDIEILLTTLPK